MLQLFQHLTTLVNDFKLETTQHFVQLRNNGCYVVQGYQSLSQMLVTSTASQYDINCARIETITQQQHKECIERQLASAMKDLDAMRAVVRWTCKTGAGDAGCDDWMERLTSLVSHSQRLTNDNARMSQRQSELQHLLNQRPSEETERLRTELYLSIQEIERLRTELDSSKRRAAELEARLQAVQVIQQGCSPGSEAGGHSAANKCTQTI